jgi:hypothetical protein
VKRTSIIGSRHQLSEFLTHTPSAFVGHAGLTLNFLRRDAVTRAGHEIHDKKPDRQLRSGFVKNGVRGWIDVVAALLAGEGAAFGHHVEPGQHTAGRAVNFRAAEIDFHQLRQARLIVGILGLKLLEGEFRHRHHSPCG